MITNWHSEDTKFESDVINDNNDTSNQLFYTIYIFGVNHQGESCCLKVINFNPSFYVRIPLKWGSTQVCGFVNQISRTFLRNRKNELKSFKKVDRKNAYGFHNDEKTPFLRLSFTNERTMRSVRWAIKNKKIQGYESIKELEIFNGNYDTLLRFMHIRGLLASGWIRVSNKRVLKKWDGARVQHGYELSWEYIEPLDYHLIPPVKILSFDIECYSESRGFPDAKNKQDIITQIGTSVWKFSQTAKTETSTTKTVIVVGKCKNELKDVNIIQVSSERKLIREWAKLVIRENPDMIIGYNIQGFDWRYLCVRAESLGILTTSLSLMSRLDHLPGSLKELKLASKTSQGRCMYTFDIPGIVELELLEWFRKNTKLDSYKLDAVAEHFLKEHKRPVSPQEIFEMSGPISGTPESRQTVADYCAQDTLLPLRLLENRCMLPNLIEMSKCTHVPMVWLLNRGQQIKVYSQVQRYLRLHEYVLPEIINKYPCTIEGAIVLNCKAGYYCEPVAGLDFKSLYPSIIIAHNLCLTTLVRNKKYLNLPGIEYETYKWDHQETGYQHCYIFVKNRPGILPEILRTLWDLRTQTKEEMGKEKDPAMKAILNAKQLAVKITMNSIYGVFGAKTGPLSVNPIAAVVTYMGRTMIQICKSYVEDTYTGTNVNADDDYKNVKGEVIYGDSIPGHIPVTILHPSTGIILPIRIDSLRASKWLPMRDGLLPDQQYTKEMAFPLKGTKVWSHQGWVDIECIIRHKAPNKRMFRITTKQGIVEVTEDHSLLREDGTEVCPKDVKIGDKLLHRFIDTRPITTKNKVKNLR